MTTKQITCREHGGVFHIPVRRGRPAVKCSEDNPCMKITMNVNAKKVAAIANEKAKRAPKAPALPAELTRTRKTSTVKRVEAAIVRTAQSISNGRKSGNPSLPMALAIKERLEPQGWTVRGRAENSVGAVVTASRGDELLVITVVNGEVVSQDYSLWNTDKPSVNGKPKSHLAFDPDEIGDRELARMLNGMKITWWNVLGQREETAVVKGEKIVIEHCFSGSGDEVPGDRIVKFVDHEGNGFRNFRLGALLKVGR